MRSGLAWESQTLAGVQSLEGRGPITWRHRSECLHQRPRSSPDASGMDCAWGRHDCIMGQLLGFAGPARAIWGLAAEGVIRLAHASSRNRHATGQLPARPCYGLTRNTSQGDADVDAESECCRLARRWLHQRKLRHGDCCNQRSLARALSMPPAFSLATQRADA